MSQSCCSNHICWGAGDPHDTAHELRCEHIYYSYGKTPALKDIHFRTTCGTSLALIGPNGAGKSTLLKALAGIITPSQGEIFWKNKPLSGTSHEIAYLPQRSQVNWSFPITIRSLVEMGRYPAVGLWGRFKAHDKEIVDRALETLDLQNLQDRQIGALSGGQQQRAFLARALAQEAHVLLLDEPFTGLDAPTCQSLQGILKTFTGEGRLLIASHHDLATVAELFDQALLLNKEVIAFGEAEQVLTSANLRQAYASSHNTIILPDVTAS